MRVIPISSCATIKKMLTLHAHATQGFDGQASRARNIVLNSGVSDLTFSREPEVNAVACIGIDNAINQEFLDCKASGFKVAVVLETPDLAREAAESARRLSNRLNLLITHDPVLLKEFPSIGRKLWLGGSYLHRGETLAGTKKSSMISISSSRKNFLEGHRLRHLIISEFRPKGLRVFGNGYKPYRSPATPYSGFRFTLAIENAVSDSYFTEKLIHPLLFRTVPVYWGTTVLPGDFDERGILRFDSLEELRSLWVSLTEERYQNLLPYVLLNQRAALSYCSTELTIQRIISNELDLPQLAGREIGHFFTSLDALIEGRERFLPHPKTKFIPRLVHRFPPIIEACLFKIRAFLGPFKRTLQSNFANRSESFL